jgi:predicted MFS family arabinose efflux permease
MTTPPLWHATLAGAAASLAGIGLARFAYTPLLPAIIAAHWFSPADASYLSAANLAGYLAGVIAAAPLAQRFTARMMLRAMMMAVTIALFACAVPVNFVWFFAWRLVSGLGGGVMMVLAAPTILPHVPPARRGMVSGIIFTGVGLGIVASGTLIPLLLRQGLSASWIGLGAICLILTLIAWNGWPSSLTPAAAIPHPKHRPAARAVWPLYGEYALNAVGLVPHMIFFAVFVARGLHQGLERGARYWVIFGLGAAAGPLLTGNLADRCGHRTSLRLAFLIGAVAILLPAVNQGSTSLTFSCAIMGALTPGIVPLVLGRIHEVIAHHPEQQKAVWGTATTWFAAAQAAGAYAMSFVLAHSDNNYRLLFMLGATANGLALLLDLCVARPGRLEQ